MALILIIPSVLVFSFAYQTSPPLFGLAYFIVLYITFMISMRIEFILRVTSKKKTLFKISSPEGTEHFKGDQLRRWDEVTEATLKAEYVVIHFDKGIQSVSGKLKNYRGQDSSLQSLTEFLSLKWVED